MSARLAAWGVWTILAASVAISALNVIGRLRTGNIDSDSLFVIPLLAYTVVGAVVAARRPEHRIGWIFSAVGLAAAIAGVQIHLAQPPLAGPGREPLRAAVSLLATVGWSAFLALALVFSLLLFPTGRLPSPRWRPVAWLAGLGIVGFGLGDHIRQALGAEDGAVGETAAVGLATLAGNIGGVVFVLTALSSAASLIVRFRRSRGQERQQLKWFAAATALVAAMAVAAMLTSDLPLVPEPVRPVLQTALQILWPLSMATIPLAAGLAVLRYRLYEIDVIINRTLVYGLLTGLLAAIYFGGVVVLQGLFRSLTGQESNLAIVVATLAAAALFQPLRVRLQRFIDRRFYRHKYDAARTLAAFSARLRDEVDLSSLTDELVAVVQQTMQPAHVSLWLRTDRGQPRPIEWGETPLPGADQRFNSTTRV